MQRIPFGFAPQASAMAGARRNITSTPVILAKRENIRRSCPGHAPVQAMSCTSAETTMARTHRIPCRSMPLNLVILDRDGVINEALPHHVRSVEDWRPIPGESRCDRTAEPGRLPRHCRDQPAGDPPTLLHLRRPQPNPRGDVPQLAEYGGAVDAIFICLCLPRHDCECFRPRPSILHEIAERLRVSLDSVPCIGDGAEVIEAAVAAGARPMLVLTGNGEAAVRGGLCPDEIEVHADLASAVDTLLTAH